MEHPRLGRLSVADGDTPDQPDQACRWETAVALPAFAARGVGLRREDDPPPGMVRIQVEEWPHGGVGISPEQDAAIAHLLDREPEVFAAVWAELAPQFADYDLQAGVICTGVEVSGLHVDGVAYMGFSIDCDGHLEHGFQVVYHPTRGTWWGDWEALNAIEEADNLEPPPED